MACVAVATFAQNLTGFALSLVMLGLVAVFHLASVADAANTATILTMVNALTYFRAHRASPPWQMMKPALWASLIGVPAGLALLGWLSSGWLTWLRLLLGVSIVACAVLLLWPRRALAHVAAPRSFAVAGLVSGLLGGLFSTSGPPMVYHMYRQPIDQELARRALLLSFAANSAIRLVIVLVAGRFSTTSVWLCVGAVPVVYGVTRLSQRRHRREAAPSAPSLSPRTVQWIVAALLVAAGATLVGTAIDVLIETFERQD